MSALDYGTWDGSISVLRERFGEGLRGVGGMDKSAFGANRAKSSSISYACRTSP